MKSTVFASVAALAVQRVAGHALFQQLWVDGKDMGSTCIRMPTSNTPVTNVGGRDIVCGLGGAKGVAGKCDVKAGGSVTVEMHQQPGDRSCKNEAIGGAHYGPVTVYLTKVPDAATADGTSTSWFKIFEDGWSSKSGVGDNDNWGTKDLNTCCGKMDVKLPTSLPDGDYLLRAEALALHTAQSSGGAQFYISCYQVTMSGGNGTLPTSPLVKFPGAYKGADPGIMVNIHAALKGGYVVPGPAVIAGGTTKVAGSGCEGAAAAAGAAAPVTGGKTKSNGKSRRSLPEQWQA